MALSLVACSSNEITSSSSLEVESIIIEDIKLATEDKDVVVEYTLLPEGAEGDVEMVISDESIATVTDGKISAVAEGETELTITFGKIKSTAKVTVKAREWEIDDSNDDSSEVNNTTKANTSTGASSNDSTSSKSSSPAVTQSAPAANPATSTAEHYHGNGTDQGVCPVCGVGYSPNVDPNAGQGNYGDFDDLFEEHYHGNGTDQGVCPVCGVGYSPNVNPDKNADKDTSLNEDLFN